MAAIKCIIRQDWETRSASGELLDRHNRVYVTNEDGTPHVYGSIKEARAEIVSNYGRDANRSGILHNYSVDDYSGNAHSGWIYIVREGSEEYAEATESAEAEQETTEQNAAELAEIIAEQARDYYADTKYSAITAEDVEQADAYTNNHLPLTVEVMNALGIFHASNRMMVAIAQAMRWTLDDIEAQAIEEAHEQAARDLISAYAEAIGDAVTEDDPEAIAAHQVAREAIGYTTATEEQRATVAAMVEAIADRAGSQVDNAAERAAIEACAAEAMEDNRNSEDAINVLAYDAFNALTGEHIPQTEAQSYQLDRLMDYAAEIVRQYGSAYGIQMEDETEPATETADMAAIRNTRPAEAIEAAEQAVSESLKDAATAERKARKECESIAADMEDGDTEHANLCARWAQFEARAAATAAREAREHASKAGTETAAKIAEKAESLAALARQHAGDAAATAAAVAIAAAEPAPIYQRAELLAYLGEPDAYDVDAIEAEATRYTADGARVWAAFGDDLAAIAERHELYSYAAI